MKSTASCSNCDYIHLLTKLPEGLGFPPLQVVNSLPKPFQLEMFDFNFSILIVVYPLSYPSSQSKIQ